jgi:hypothetical protein
VSHVSDIMSGTEGDVVFGSESVKAESDVGVTEVHSSRAGTMVLVSGVTSAMVGATVGSATKRSDGTARLSEPGGEAETAVSGDTMRESSSVGELIVKLRNADRNVGYLLRASCTFRVIEFTGEEIRVKEGLITCQCQKRLTRTKKRSSELANAILTTQRSDEDRESTGGLGQACRGC